jgi:hypothetical protein
MKNHLKKDTKKYYKYLVKSIRTRRINWLCRW